MKSRDDHSRSGTSAAPAQPDKPSLASLGGWRALFANPGLVLNTLRHGAAVGEDDTGNRYFQDRRAGGRRWVVYAGRSREASLVPAEWHGWLHFTTDAPLAAHRKPWQRPHQPNLTGTRDAYRPKGHEYQGGVRVAASADYEPWTPDA